MGDSVLDNHYWLDRPADDVRAQTERTLRDADTGRTIHVDNFAVDESTVACVLRGRMPAAQYREGRKRARMEPYPADQDGIVRPLSLLRKSRPTHVVSLRDHELSSWCRVTPSPRNSGNMFSLDPFFRRVMNMTCYFVGGCGW